MSASEIAERHFSAAMAEAERAGTDHDGVCRALLGLIVSKYLERRSVSDVQSELRFVADNCDPDTDFATAAPSAEATDILRPASCEIIESSQLRL